MATKPKYEAQDVVTVRRIEHKGIVVFVEINRLTRKASLVEAVANGKFQPKKWVFAEREIGFMVTWTEILEAMKIATENAMDDIYKYTEEQAELEAIRNAELDKLLGEVNF